MLPETSSIKARLIDKFDERIVKKGVELAFRSQMLRRHASVIVQKIRGEWRIVVRGYNEKFERDGKIWSIHSEVAALRKLRKTKASEFIMFNVSIGRRGDLRISKPCDNCARALEKAKINCYYTV